MNSLKYLNSVFSASGAPAYYVSSFQKIIGNGFGKQYGLCDELIDLLAVVWQDPSFEPYKKEFRITSVWRPAYDKDKPKNRYGALWDGESQQAIIDRGVRPAATPGKSFHNKMPAQAFDFSIGSNAVKTKAAWQVIKAVSIKKNMPIGKYIENDPYHVQLPKYKEAKDLGTYSAIQEAAKKFSSTAYQQPDQLTKKKVEELKVSDIMINMIRIFENSQLYNDVLKNGVEFKCKAYWDVKQWAIGWGVMLGESKSYENTVITVKEMETKYFKPKLESLESSYKKKLKEHKIVEMYQHEFDALFDIYYTAGTKEMHSAITRNFFEAYNKEQSEVARHFVTYTIPSGIINRRIAETLIFKYGVYNPSIKALPNGLSFPSKVYTPKASLDAIKDIYSNLGIFSSGSSTNNITADETFMRELTMYYKDPNSKTVVEFGKSSFANNEVAKFFHKNKTFLDLLKKVELRSPGTYFDVLEDGFFATLFLGKANYYVDRTDIIFQKDKMQKEAKFMLEHLVTNGFFNEEKSKIGNYKKLVNSVKPFTSSGIASDENAKPYSVNDKEGFYEKASNTIFVVSGKNLVSNNLIVNNNVANCITVDYNPTFTEKLEEALTGKKFISKASLFAFPSIQNFEDRIKEKIVEFDDVCTLSQAIEVGQAHLQKELEKYYDGTVIALFCPEIKYRSEIFIYDNVNEVYGSFLVREFEHKLDGRGAYTIIKPMLKIEQSAYSKEMIKGFWNKIFFTREANSRYYNELPGLINRYFKNVEVGYEMTNEVLNEIYEKYINDVPISLGNYAFKNSVFDGNKGEVDDIRVLSSSYGLSPFKAFPLLSKGRYLMPDLDLYGIANDSFWSRLTKWRIRSANKIHDFFFSNKKEETNLNLKQWFYNSLITRNRTNTGQTFYDEVSKNGIFNTQAKTKSVAVYNNTKNAMLNNQLTTALDFTFEENPNELSIGFMNFKILEVSHETRIANFAKIIKRYEVFCAVEIAAKDIKEAEAIYKKIVDKLNKDKITGTFSTTPLIREIRENGMVSENGTPEHKFTDTKRLNEYGMVFRRKNVSASISGVLQLATAREKSVNGKTQAFTVNSIQVVLKKNDINTKIAFLHNIYEPYSYIIEGKEYIFPEAEVEYIEKEKLYSSRVLNSAKRRDSIIQLLNYSKDIDYIFGDFNMNIVNEFSKGNSYGLDESYTLYLTDNPYTFTKDNLSYVFSDTFKSLFSANEKTTVTGDYLKNSFDKILANVNSVDSDGKRANNYGVDKSALGSDYLDFTNEYSDHLPIFLKVGV